MKLKVILLFKVTLQKVELILKTKQVVIQLTSSTLGT